MKTHRLLVIDTETGGLDSNEHSILSLAAVIWNSGSIEAKFQVVIREPQMSTTLEALRINGFTMEVLETEGVSPATAVMALENFLLINDFRTRATLAGHNVGFDIGFLKRLYRLGGRSPKEYEKLYSHRALCTQTLALALQTADRCNFKGTGLDSLCKFFGIEIRAGGSYGRHDALEDATATALLLTKELDLIRNPAQVVPEQVEIAEPDSPSKES